MFKSFLMPLLTATTLALFAGQGAIAADANHPEASFRAVVNMGFRVVSTEPIPAEAAQAVGMNTAVAITIVTLEKGPAVAVCTFSTKDWIFMTDTDLESATGCDYRDYSSATPPATPAVAPAAPAPATTAPAAPAPAASSPAAPASGHSG